MALAKDLMHNGFRTNWNGFEKKLNVSFRLWLGNNSINLPFKISKFVKWSNQGEHKYCNLFSLSLFLHKRQCFTCFKFYCSLQTLVLTICLWPSRKVWTFFAHNFFLLINLKCVEYIDLLNHSNFCSNCSKRLICHWYSVESEVKFRLVCGTCLFCLHKISFLYKSSSFWNTSLLSEYINQNQLKS